MRIRRSSHAAFLQAVALLGMLSGCWGSAGGPETAPVVGVVTLNGSPVDGATVLFHPADRAAGLKTASGVTDEAGEFRVETHVEGSTYKPGTPPGEYLVTVEKLDKSRVFETMSPPGDLLPAKYKSPQTSGFSATVESGRENRVVLELTDP